MDRTEALTVLGLEAGATLDEARQAYRRLVRRRHPDVVGPDGNDDTARLTAAFATLRAEARTDREGRLSRPDPPRPDPTVPPKPTAYEEAIEAELAGGDTLLVRAPADETFAVLLDAAGRVGHIGYLDRRLGIIESIVRFEGGPSCSLLITLQGRAMGTEAFCTLESIEATPTPPLAPVIDALVRALETGSVDGAPSPDHGGWSANMDM